MVEKIELPTAPPETITETETKTTTKIPEFPEERVARIRRANYEAIFGHVFRSVAVFVYVAVIAVCAYNLNDPKLGDFAQKTIVPMVLALAAYAVGRRQG